MKFSIILPIFNAELYLERAIKSVIDQTYTNWELLCIDDGSSDKSLLICLKYEQLDKRIRVFSKENSGVSDARNLGLEMAEGQKLVFLDADDYLDITMLEKFFQNQTAEESPLVMSNFYSVFDDRKVQGDSFTRNKIVGINQMKEFIQFVICMSQWNQSEWFGNCRAVWAKCFSMDIIQKNDIRFKSTLKVGEDMLFFLTYCLQIDSISFLNVPLYYYEKTNELSVMSQREWNGPEQGLLYYNSVKTIVGEFIEDEDLSNLWLETAETDWNNIIFSKLTIFSKYMELRKLYNSELYRYFSNFSYSKASKKKKVYIFCIKWKLALTHILLFGLRTKWLYYSKKV